MSESSIWAVMVLLISLSVTEAWPAASPEPAIPAAKERIRAGDSAVSETPPAPAVIVEAVIVACTLLSIRFLETAAPAAPKPDADTPMATESMVDRSRAKRESPPAVISAELTAAVTSFSIVLMDVDTWAETTPEAATPPEKLKISASDRAVRLMAPPLSTVASSIFAEMVLSISL